MNILVASAEVDPFAKSGGLADVAAALPAEWNKYGQNPIIIMPKYGFINCDLWGFKPMGLTLNVPMSYWTEFAQLWHGNLPNSDVPVYLIEHNHYFDRKGIYGDPHEYGDNDRRFIFFSRAIFEAAKALNFTPDIIHAHDFHTAFAMAFLQTHYRFDYRFSKTAGVYTIHNLAYQGKYNPKTALDYAGFGSDTFYPGSWFEFYNSVNFMKVGIMFADKITTVSPNYSAEIRNQYFGEGLQDVLNHRGGDLVGILNGANYNEWNPENDTMLQFHYNKEDMSNKKALKYQFLLENGLNEDDNLDMPLFGLVTRLVEQKGIDLLINKFEDYLHNSSFRLALLGSGDKNYEDYFNYLKWKYPKLALIHTGYNNQTAHRIIAASDFLLVPSRFEPCGLTQMYAMKYGTIPIVRATGGLADTVQEYQTNTGNGNGFLFWQYNADDFAWAVRRALTVYQNDPHWDLIRKNAMDTDFSASKSALEYLKVFNWALEKVR